MPYRAGQGNRILSQSRPDAFGRGGHLTLPAVARAIYDDLRVGDVPVDSLPQ